MRERAARCRDEQGAVELFVLVVVLALIVGLGIVVDLGAKMRTDDQAAWTAQQAARVAASQVSAQIQGGLPVVADQGGAAIVVPGVILILAVTIMAGRVALAKGQVDTAANEAARAASIARTPTDADTAARNTVTAPLGQTGHVTVTCTAPLTSLPIFNLGDQTITGTGTSVVDPHRSRT